MLTFSVEYINNCRIYCIRTHKICCPVTPGKYSNNNNNSNSSTIETREFRLAFFPERPQNIPSASLSLLLCLLRVVVRPTIVFVCSFCLKEIIGDSSRRSSQNNNANRRVVSPGRALTAKPEVCDSILSFLAFPGRSHRPPRAVGLIKKAPTDSSLSTD